MEPYIGQTVFIISENIEFKFGLEMTVIFVDDIRVRLQPKAYGITPIVEYKKQDFIRKYMS